MAATASGWTSVHALSVGLCLALLVRMGLGHGMNSLVPNAFENRKYLDDCYRGVMALEDCAHTLWQPLSEKNRLPKGVDDPKELFLGTVVPASSVLEGISDILFENKPVADTCCRAMDEFNETCWSLDSVFMTKRAFNLLSHFCKVYSY